MTLKAFCKALGIKGIRRWKGAIAHIQNLAAKVQETLHAHVHTVLGKPFSHKVGA